MQKYKKASATWLQKPFLYKILKFRKFYPTRPERAEALSPGQRPGLLRSQTCRPVRAKALKLRQFSKLLPLQGAFLIAIIPRALPWAKSFCPFRACCFWNWTFCPYLNHLRNLSKISSIILVKVEPSSTLTIYLSCINTTARRWNNRFVYRTSKHQ